jgi:tetratricopeptide (TPR) repeat protein
VNDPAQTELVSPAEMSRLVAMFTAGRFGEMEGRARELLNLRPDSGLAWKILAVSLRMQSKDALHALERTTQLLPDDAESHSNLGNALLDLARFEDAATSYRRALELTPSFAEAHSNLGNALRGLGRLDEAVASYRDALELMPNLAEAHNNLGNALRGLGRLDEAVVSYGQALELRPHDAEAHLNLGNALHGLGRHDDALASYRHALRLSPNFAEAHNNLGNVLRSIGQLDEAAASYRHALEIKPDYAGAHSNLSDALRDLGQLEDAVASGSRALEFEPDNAGAHNSLGNALLDLGMLDDAEASYRRSLALDPRGPEAHVNLGIVQRLQGREVDAEANCQAALATDPASTAALTLLGELHADKGQFSDAEALFQRALAIDTELPEALAAIVHLRKMSAEDAGWLAQARQSADAGLPPRREVYLRYALGKYFDDVKDFDQAFLNYRRANDLTKLYGTKHDRIRLSSDVSRTIRNYDGEWLGRSRNTATGSSRAVFIVGMPRSGTTLAEQILASHPAVFGAGELPFWGNAAATHEPSTPVGAMSDEYLSRLSAPSTSTLRVIDKMPANFLSLGLIHAALPDARIIHMQRNPLDTCLSIYFQHFKGTHAYANDLDDLAHYYAEYRRVMAHWRSIIPKNLLLEVPYEGLVENQEEWSRAMIDFIGLSWDPICMDFHRTARTVVTASKWQVRQRITSASVARWRNYEKFLGPLVSLTSLAYPLRV